MAAPLPRYRTGRAELDALLSQLLDEAAVEANRDQIFEILVTALRLAHDQASRLDLKIANAALKEMRSAFKVFAPYRRVPKVTIFGSARTLPDDPLYVQTRTLASEMAAAGWMVVTGAGPGIMAAGMEGAGRDMSFGVNIRLPFEQSANEFIATDPKLVDMRYFFTRKLMLVKESDGLVVLPGGFGTLDETFELLTLLQTGKAEPAPIVLLEVPGGTYWQAWERFIDTEVVTRRLVSPEDRQLFRVTDDVKVATDEILGFYLNYHSRRFVRGAMVIRLRKAPTPEELERLNADFADIVVAGRIEATGPTEVEVGEGDCVELERIAFRFDLRHQGRLRQLIDALNALPSAPREPRAPEQ